MNQEEVQKIDSMETMRLVLDQDDFLESAPVSLATRDPEGHKGDYGRVLIIAGSRRYAGAAALAAEGAARGGAGLVELAVPESIADRMCAERPSRIVSSLPETADGQLSFAALRPLKALAETADAVVVGPGLGQSAALADLVQRLVGALHCPCVLDADGINLVSSQNPKSLQDFAAPIVLTPHPGEAARFLGTTVEEIQSDRQLAAQRMSLRSGAVVALKGHGTVVCHKSSLWVNGNGNPGMATGGSGDLLSGLVAALCCQSLIPYDAARLSVYVHGRAGDQAAEKTGQVALTPEDLMAELAGVIRECGG